LPWLLPLATVIVYVPAATGRLNSGPW
jgi:hypothetical protein